MTLKFDGTLNDLQAAMHDFGMDGRWEKEPNGVHMLRIEGGVNMHWASTTKTVWFDGCEQAKRELVNRLRTAFADVGNLHGSDLPRFN